MKIKITEESGKVMRLFDTAEILIEEGEFGKACEFIGSNADEIGAVGCEYLLGRIYNSIEDYSEAVMHFNNALQNTSFDKAIYAELTDVYEKSGQLSEAECAYENLLKLENDRRKKWAIYTDMADFYKRHEMWLKMENIGNRLRKNYPNNYMGNHLLFEASLGRGRDLQCEIILNHVSDIFRNIIPYILDCVNFYKKKENYELLFSLLEEHSDILGGSFVLKEKVRAYIETAEYEKAEENIYKLAVDYGDLEAIISLMVLLVSKEKYEEAILIGQYVLSNIDEIEVYFIYLIKVVSVMSKYRLGVEQNSFDDVQMKEELDDLIHYMESNTFYDDDIMKFWLGFRDGGERNRGKS